MVADLCVHKLPAHSQLAPHVQELFLIADGILKK